MAKSDKEKTYREYVFVDENLRNGNVDLRNYEDVIKKSYGKFAPWVRIEVENDKYIVYGSLSRSDIQKTANHIMNRTVLGKFRVLKHYTKDYRYLFKCK